MTLFWTLALVMLLIGVAWILPPLVRPERRPVGGREEQNIEIARERLLWLETEFSSGAIEKEQYDRSRLEIEEILASDLESGSNGKIPAERNGSSLKSAIVVGLFVPLLSILLYGFLGNPQGLFVQRGQTASAAANGDRRPSVEEMVNRLAERLEENPNNPDGWRLLARSYAVMERYPEAVEALRRARGLVGDDPDLLIELADVSATAQNDSFDGEPAELIAKVLEKFPEHTGALWLAGRSAVMARDLPQALKYWRKLESVLPRESEGLESVRFAIARVEEAMGLKPGAGVPAESTAPKDSGSETAVSPGPELRVQVSMDQALAANADPEDAVFIYAQAMNGPPMPLAVTRRKVRDLPFQVTLNDSMAMMPAMVLSKFSEVRVIARVSKTGNAIPQSGDFKGQVEPVSVAGKAPVEILIAEKIP